MTADEVPAGLSVGTETEPLDTPTLDVLARLVAAGDNGAHLTGPDGDRAGALDELADVLAPTVGIELGRWCAASVAGLEVAQS